MKPGDIIAFSGKGNFSELIKWATASVISHVGIVFESRVLFPSGEQPGMIVDVMESTTLHVDPDTGTRVAGVQRNRLSLRLKYYDGVIWWLPLSEQCRQTLDLKSFTDFLMHTEGLPYDLPQAIRSALDAMDSVSLLNGFTYNSEDFSSFFCSELAAAALERGGAIRSLNCSEVTPADLCSFALYSDDYFQMKGEAREIRWFNSLDPDDFGE